MRTAGSIWVGNLTDLKFETPGATTRAAELADQLAKTPVTQFEIGELIAELETRAKQLRDIGANPRASSVADVLERATNDLRTRVVQQMSSRTRPPNPYDNLTPASLDQASWMHGFPLP